MDVPNACLHEDLKAVIHMLPSLGLIILKVMRCANLFIKEPILYGLNQATQAWFDEYHSTVLEAGFNYRKLDASIFFLTYLHECYCAFVLLVSFNDILITGNNSSRINHLNRNLHSSFHIIDLGNLTFLGLRIHESSQGVFINQHKHT